VYVCMYVCMCVCMYVCIEHKIVFLYSLQICQKKISYSKKNSARYNDKCIHVFL
jgi:hypothetical protein